MRDKLHSNPLRAGLAAENKSMGGSKVDSQEQTAAEEPFAKLVYSVRETAELLGVHANTIRRAIERGELRAVRLGDRVLIPRNEIWRLLEGGPHAN